MTLLQNNIADTVREMTPDECEVFELILNGFNPADPQDVKQIASRIDAPVTDLILSLHDKQLLTKSVSTEGVCWQVNPAAVWFLAAPKDRTYVRR